MYNQGVQRYRETDISSISKEKLIVLLYEKMQSDLLIAQRALQNSDRVEMTKQVNHSQRIVAELRGALDHSIGGDVSRNLESLYDYLFHEHLEVLVDQKEEHLTNCLRVIAPLLDAWRQIPAGTGDSTARHMSVPAVGPNPANEKLNPDNSAGNPTPGQQSILSVSA